MINWIDNFMLKLFLLMCSPHIILLLILNQFKVCLMGSVSDVIQALGVVIEFVLAGCTGLCQLIVVGVNKPFKANMTKIYTLFMFAQVADKPLRSTTWVCGRDDGVDHQRDCEELLEEDRVQLLRHPHCSGTRCGTYGSQQRD
jgi:hypothetical protein